MLVLIAVLGIGLLVHQLFELRGVLETDLEDPAVLLSLVVDEGGISLHVLVVSGNLSSNGGVDVGGSLDRLNTADTITLNEAGANLSDIQVDNVTELTLGVVCDADLCLLYNKGLRIFLFNRVFISGNKVNRTLFLS